MRVTEAISQFLFHCRYEKNLSPKTLKAYSIDLRQFSEHLVTHLSISALDLIDKTALRHYIKSLFSELAEKSVKRKVASLKAMFHFLEREDILTANPFRKMDVRIRETRRLPRTIALADLKRLFRHLYRAKRASPDLESHDHHALVRDIAVLETLFATGARVAEVCHLKLEDVDLRRGRVRVLGKGARERVLQVPDHEALAALHDYRALCPDDASAHFFYNRLGRRLSEQSVRAMLRRRASQAGLTLHITPHMLRHSVATLLLEQGVDIRYIQYFLGHSSIMTTQIYTEVHGHSNVRILAARHPRRLFRGSKD